MRVRLATSLREFDALAPVWRELTRESGQTSPFLSHDWFACCWRTAGPDRRREAWVIENSSGPVALLPLAYWQGRLRSLPVRMLGVLESPDTPFVELPALGPLEDVIETFLARLREKGGWDILRLSNLPAHSLTFKALGSVLSDQFPWRVVRQGQSPYLRISGTWEAFFRAKTQRFRKTCRGIENRIRRHGKVTVEEHRQVDPDGALFTEVMEVSRLSWKGARGLAMATMQGMPRFFRELTQRASTNGWLHLWILRLDGCAVATEYQIGADGQLHALRADFDPALGDLSPGAYLNLYIIRSLFERQGVHQYNMGPGPNEYKLRWATDADEVVALEVYAPTPYGRFLHAIETRLVPLARRWRTQLTRRRCA